MFNLIRAAFWIAVVACFMPSNPVAQSIAGGARQGVAVLGGHHAANTRVADATVSPDLNARVHSASAYGDVAAVCGDEPDLCSAGVKAVDQAQDLAVEGLNALAAAIDDDRKVQKVARN